MKLYNPRSHTAKQRPTCKPSISISERQARSRRKQLAKLFKYPFTFRSPLNP